MGRWWERKRCPCPHSANKQKVNTERDTRYCLHSSTCLLRFHSTPFCQPWDKRHVKANTALHQGRSQTMERERSHPTLLFAEIQTCCVRCTFLPPSPLPRGNSSRPKMRLSVTLLITSGSFSLGFLLLEHYCSMPDDVISRDWQAQWALPVWRSAAVSVLVGSSW